MRLLVLIMSMLFSTFCMAEVLMEEIVCQPSAVADGGYRFTLRQGIGHSYGSLHSISFAGTHFIGTDEVNVDIKHKRFGCEVRLTQVSDVDGNELDLVIKIHKPGSGNLATLNMNIDGRPISDYERPMSCHVYTQFFNDRCAHNNQRLGGQTPSRVGQQ